MQHLDSILTLLGIIISCSSLLFAFIIYCRQAKDRRLKELALQIKAYYAEEQEAMKWIADLTGDNLKTIQTELRNRAKENENSGGERPDMTSGSVKKYL